MHISPRRESARVEPPLDLPTHERQESLQTIADSYCISTLRMLVPTLNYDNDLFICSMLTQQKQPEEARHSIALSGRQADREAVRLADDVGTGARE